MYKSQKTCPVPIYQPQDPFLSFRNDSAEEQDDQETQQLLAKISYLEKEIAHVKQREHKIKAINERLSNVIVATNTKNIEKFMLSLQHYFINNKSKTQQCCNSATSSNLSVKQTHRNKSKDKSFLKKTVENYDNTQSFNKHANSALSLQQQNKFFVYNPSISRQQLKQKLRSNSTLSQLK